MSKSIIELADVQSFYDADAWNISEENVPGFIQGRIWVADFSGWCSWHCWKKLKWRLRRLEYSRAVRSEIMVQALGKVMR